MPDSFNFRGHLDFKIVFWNVYKSHILFLYSSIVVDNRG